MPNSVTSLSFQYPVACALRSAAPPQPLVITETTIGGKRYRIEAIIEDRNGNRVAYSTANYSREALQQMESYARDLFAAHDLQHNTLSQRPLELIGADSQGLIRPDYSTASHNFFIHPLNPEIAARAGGRNAPALKAQDIWNRLNNSLLRPQFKTPLPQGRTTPISPGSPDAVSQRTEDDEPIPTLEVEEVPPAPPTPDNPTPPPSPTVQPPPPDVQPPPPQPTPPRPWITVPATTVQLEKLNHNFEAKNWYETIPLRTRLRILTNMRRIDTPSSHVEQRVRARFQAIFDRMIPSVQARNSVPYLLGQEHHALKQQCAHLPRTLPDATVQAAERFLKRLAQCATRQELRDLKQQIHTDEELARYLQEQIEAEGLVAADIHRAEWTHAHYSLFARVLERYLDNH